MAIAPWATKALIGVSGISAVSVGGVAIHQGYFSGNSKKHKGWRVETKEENGSIVVSVVEYKLNSEKWVCQIKTTKPTDTNKPEGIRSQIKKELGIKDDGTMDESKKDAFNEFKKNCERYKSSSEATMDLGSIALDQTGNDYKLNGEEFNKTFKEIYLTKEYKEGLGLPGDCKVMKSSDSESCKLNADALKKVRFEGKTNDTQTNLESDKTVMLKIEQTSEGIFPKNLRFVFVASEKDVTVSSGNSDSAPLDLKKGTSINFRVKTNGNTNTLEKTNN